VDFLPAFGAGGSPPTYHQREIAALFRRDALRALYFFLFRYQEKWNIYNFIEKKGKGHGKHLATGYYQSAFFRHAVFRG
jgi:hypothetical protein